MAKHPLWSDEYWLLLLQLYLKKPTGVKALYARPLVNLALELHIPPQYLYQQMFRFRSLDTPRIERLWDKYAASPQKLQRAVRLLRQKNGYGNAGDFFQGVEVNETWEKDFKPITADEAMTPVMLILILDLYFRLIPSTMVPETPEVAELAKLIRLKPARVAEIMQVYQSVDPCLKPRETEPSALTEACRNIWRRFGNDNPEKLAALAAQLKAYFK